MGWAAIVPYRLNMGVGLEAVGLGFLDAEFSKRRGKRLHRATACIDQVPACPFAAAARPASAQPGASTHLPRCVCSFGQDVL